MGLGPPETHWPLEKFQTYSEDDLMRDVFEDGHVDVAIFQPTYLKEWYTDGFNTTERNARAGREAPRQVHRQHPLGPARGRRRAEGAGGERRPLGLHGRQALHRRVARRLAGLDARDPEAFRFLETRQELGVRNIHVHKGPTIWPLDKDAFDVADVDNAATDFPELNFIVEHVGLPRIEDFCFMAMQEPNVYAGLSVVIGGLMHARPRFFAKVMGELLFWLGEDRLIFGSDYAIWEPRWQVEGFVDWDYPRRRVLRVPAAHDDGQEEDPRPQRRPALRHRRARRVPARRGDAGRAGRREAVDAELVTGRPWSTAVAGRPGAGRAGRGPRPRAGRAGHRRWASSPRATCRPDGDGPVRLRLPTYFCAPNFAFLMVADAHDAVGAVPGVRRAEVVLDDHFAADAINAGVAARAGLRRDVRGRWPRASSTSCGRLPAQGGAGRHRPGVPAAAGRRPRPAELAGLTLGDAAAVARPGPAAGPAGRARAARRRRRRRCSSTRRPAPRRRRRRLPLHLRRARLTRVSIEANSGICRGMLRHRYATSGEGARRGGGPMKAVRLHGYHQQPVVEEVPEPAVKGPFDVVVKVGGAGVCRTDLHIIEGQWDDGDEPGAAVHARPRERRLGAGGRLRGDQRRGRGHRDPAPDTDLRAVPRLPGRRGHALRATALPGPRQRRRHGRVPAHLRPGLREARPSTQPEDVAALADAGITAYHAVRKAVPLLYPGTTCVVIGAGGLGHIGIQCLAALTATSVIVVDRNPTRSKLAGSSAPTTPWWPTATTSRRCRTSPTARAPTWCSTSSPSRARRTRVSR